MGHFQVIVQNAFNIERMVWGGCRKYSWILFHYYNVVVFIYYSYEFAVNISRLFVAAYFNGHARSERVVVLCYGVFVYHCSTVGKYCFCFGMAYAIEGFFDEW